ncbi:MAG: SdrD B-like domain-containing protein [Candidatus Eiseniibacteriota bacterium]
MRSRSTDAVVPVFRPFRTFRSPARTLVALRHGFSLVEMMITLTLLALVVAVVATVMMASGRSKAETEGRIDAQQSARAISDLITLDLRTAGYQVDTGSVPEQPAFAYVDSLEIVFNANLTPFPDTMVTALPPHALLPVGTAGPPKIEGTPYEPPIKYTTGAEMIRYTLDLNNDGNVDAADQAAAIATEAQRTRNPDDYVLARAVYGDFSGGVSANNGGSLQKVGIVRGPGTGVPAMFTVYLGSNPNPWNWSDGPIPQADLLKISRVVLRVTTEGRVPRKDGTYPRNTLTTEINSIRNSPTAGTLLYSVEGWVFDDLNRNGTRDTGEPGIPDAMLRMGTVSVAQSNASGWYSLKGPPNEYVVRQEVPEGYGAFAADSILVDFIATPVNVMHSFADTARTGAWLLDSCYVDTNTNGMKDAGDEVVDGVQATVNGTTRTSDGGGGISIFLPPGTHSVSHTAPESMVVLSVNPATISITNGVNSILYTKLTRSATGTVTGYVFRDLNRNGVKDTGEAGVSSAWVGVTKSGGTVTLGFSTTDTNGYYEVTAPVNMPDAVTPYEVTFIAPPGFYPTSSTQISPIWIAAGEVLTDKNFGVSTFTTISLNADRVLSLTSGDLLEKDWSGSDNSWDTKGSFDKDLILGSEYVANPNVSVWWNNMPLNPVFNPDPTYAVNAQSSALSVVAGSLDSNVPTQREDVVTGLARKPGGNVAVWLNQNSSGNLGFLVTTPVQYQTADNGDAHAVVLEDCGGTSALDLIVGTKNLADRGTLEVWLNNGLGTFTRDEIYPPNGNFPLGILGEVKALVLVDATNDGYRDLIVGTRITDGFGQIHVMRFNTRNGGDRYRQILTYNVVGEVTSMAWAYVDSDLQPDLVVGTRITSVRGDLQYWKGLGSGQFALVQTFDAPGPVLSVVRSELGGNPFKNDIAFGFRNDESAYSGGVRILFLDLNMLPPGAVDPAGGTHEWMTPSITSANFNYRLNPTTSGGAQLDLAAATKTGASTGALLVFIR